jgi:hypothetical protein
MRLKMSEKTDAYMQGWAAGWNMAKHATTKIAVAMFEEVKCGNEPDSCETPEHCAEMDLMIERLKRIEK